MRSRTLAIELAKQTRAAAVGLVDAQHHAQRRRLAGAVGAEKAENFAALQREAEIVDRGEIAEALGHAFEFKRDVRQGILGFGGREKMRESSLTSSYDLTSERRNTVGAASGAGKDVT